MAGEDNEGSATIRCGTTELVVFLCALAAGTACSICSKTMMNLHAVGVSGKKEKFEKPIFQTFGMFVGMMFGLVMHWVVVCFKIPFPGYVHESPSSSSQKGSEASEKDALLKKSEEGAKSSDSDSKAPNVARTPAWMYYFVAIPSIFDIAATALCMMGLRYLDVSIYQLLRGSGIIFVALMKQYALGNPLYKFQWIGVFWNIVSVVLVSATALLDTGNDENTEKSEGAGDAFLGVSLVMFGAFVQALQFVFEEKVMALDDAAAPPLLLLGMEGLWGTVICLFVVYPLVYFIPGKDHGSYEDPFNTFEMFWNSSTIKWAFVVYFFAIFGYNLFAVLVTFMLNSVWHSILDNFRPISVWGTDLIIFYVVTAGSFGEPWTKYSWIQLLGVAVLLYGTSIYNAPNKGSIWLLGEWWNFGIDLNEEYETAKADMEGSDESQSRGEGKEKGKTKGQRLWSKHSPNIMAYTQALRAFASRKL